MYYYRAIWKYFCDVNMFNAAFCVFIIWLFGIFWGVFMFCTVGILIGRYGFRIFKEDQYYMYYNLRFTKMKLLVIVFFMNLIIAFPVLILALIF